MPACPLNGPGSQGRVLVSEGDELLVAVGGRLYGELSEDASGAGVQGSGAVRVHMGVDTDDDVDDLRQTGHAFISLPGGT